MDKTNPTATQTLHPAAGDSDGPNTGRNDMYEFCFPGSNQWFASPYTSERDVALHAMRLHGGRIGGDIRLVGASVWAPRARHSSRLGRAANRVMVRAVSS